VAAPDTTYGSDRDGLVCGYLFTPGQPATAIGADVAAEWLSSRFYDETESFIWLHFSVANVAAERWMLHHLTLPDGFVESFHETSTAMRVEQADTSLLAVVHDITFASAEAEADAATVSLFVDTRIMVSARRTPLRSVDRLRAAVKAGGLFRSPVELLAHLLRDQADVLAGIVHQATSRVDDIEDFMLAHGSASRRALLSGLRRMLVRLQRLLAPEPAALFRLLGRPPAWLTEADLQDLRQSAEELSAAASDSSALVERVRLLQEEAAAYIAEQNNRILFLLTLVTVLALPFNVVGSLFGMNVGGIPFGQSSHGFWIIVVIVAAFTLAASVMAWQRRQW
jgi:zinc transporter